MPPIWLSSQAGNQPDLIKKEIMAPNFKPCESMKTQSVRVPILLCTSSGGWGSGPLPIHHSATQDVLRPAKS